MMAEICIKKVLYRQSLKGTAQGSRK